MRLVGLGWQFSGSVPYNTASLLILAGETMLTKFSVRNFKSLDDVAVDLPRLTVLYGPNAAGKSNFLEAIQALEWLGTCRTLSDALDDFFPVRGHSFETFTFPPKGLSGLLQQSKASFTLEADVDVADKKFRYKIKPEIDFTSGRLRVVDELLVELTVKGEIKKNRLPVIECKKRKILIRQAYGHRPRQEQIGLNHSILSDRSLGGDLYPWLEQVREELWSWSTYSLEPRLVMRVEQSPADVNDVGPRGESVVPFLYKLKAMHSKRFEQVRRTLRTVVPAVESLDVNLDDKRGLLDLEIRQDGVNYSSRIVSEGTLRVLALCAIAMNPWQKKNSLLTFEEPENGVDPAQIDLIAKLFLSMTQSGERQVIVTTHSPMLCDAILREIREESKKVAGVGLFNVRREMQKTVVNRLTLDDPLFTDQKIVEELTGSSGEGLFQSLLQRGYA